MKTSDDQQLVFMLRELCRAQDCVTHTNEKGSEFKANTLELIQNRERIFKDVLCFVDSLASVRPTQAPADALRCTSDTGEHYFLTKEYCVFCGHERR
jgi:hypothetical protein